MEQSKSIDLSVIIVSYNVEHFLHLCLESVYAAINNINAEIIVIDNASADNSVEMMRKNSLHVWFPMLITLIWKGQRFKAAKLAKGSCMYPNQILLFLKNLWGIYNSMGQTLQLGFQVLKWLMEQDSFLESKWGCQQ